VFCELTMSNRAQLVLGIVVKCKHEELKYEYIEY